MVQVKSWDRFQKETVALYESNPTKTRYSVKFRPIDGKLTLKITDDVHTFKHSTTSSITLNRFTALNALLFEKMSATSLAPPSPPTPPPADAPASSTPSATKQPARDAMEGVESGSTPAVTPAAGGAGGSKKKKKGKGKK